MRYNVAQDPILKQIQTAIEKAMKALLVYNDIEPPITHSLAVLIKELRKTLEVPESIERVIELEDYAVQTQALPF